MTVNKERFLALVTEETDDSFMKEVNYRIENRAWLTESFGIAMKILMRLDELNWSQKDLAHAMGVTPQQINKIVRGKQNLKLETIVKLQELLKIPLLASYIENEKAQKHEHKLTLTMHQYTSKRISIKSFHTVNDNGRSNKKIKQSKTFLAKIA